MNSEETPKLCFVSEFDLRWQQSFTTFRLKVILWRYFYSIKNDGKRKKKKENNLKFQL